MAEILRSRTGVSGESPQGEIATRPKAWWAYLHVYGLEDVRTRASGYSFQHADFHVEDERDTESKK